VIDKRLKPTHSGSRAIIRPDWANLRLSLSDRIRPVRLTNRNILYVVGIERVLENWETISANVIKLIDAK
jgi:hypothetical protein